MKLPLLASATLAVLAVVPSVLSEKPSLRAVAQPIENFQEAVFDAVAKHSSRDEWRVTDSSNDTDMEMIATEVENNRKRNRRSKNRRSRNRRRRRGRSRNRRSRRNRSRRRRRSRGRRSFRRSFRRDFCRFGRVSVDRNGRLRCFDSATGMTLLSEKPMTTTTTSDDVDEYQYVMIEEKPQANDRAINDEDEVSGDDEDYDSWDEDEDEDDSSDSPDTEEW